MMSQCYVDRPSRKMLEKLPKWLPAALVFYALTVVLNSITGTGEAHIFFTMMASCLYVTAICFVLGFIVIGFYFFLRLIIGCWETWTEAQTFINRIWKIATCGPSSAGLVAEDLGIADKHGIYIRKTQTGLKLYLRLVRGSLSGDNAKKVWQWSLDKRNWTSTAKVINTFTPSTQRIASVCVGVFQAEQFWNGQHFMSGMADKILLQRLEVESAFRETQPFLNPIVQPPAIELEICSEADKERLLKMTPRNFLCPISMELMTEPVVCPSGVTYDRKSVTKWIEQHHSDPATNAALRNDHLYPNLKLRDMIQEWLVENKFIGTQQEESTHY